MSTDWNQQTRRRTETLPRHFCEGCSALCAEDAETCPDCQTQAPAQGWTSLDEAFDPFLGRVLNDRYLISKIEGRGSSSTIYRAESLDVPKRFAVKMVKLWHADEGVTEQLRTRIEREVRAVGMLRNPHIVRVYELLELDRNWIALVMDHIEGHTLEERVEDDGPFELDRACTILRQVANGLCEAHEVGMIHRDIKPANIMLERLPDGRDFAYLLDFGVVHLEGEVRMTHGFLGTPLFASPEQAVAGTIDRRSDVYSLGATFFHMLTGHAPFESDHTLEVLKAHVRQPAPTLEETCPERGFPRPIENLVARMLAKAPDDRPADLLEVIEELRRARDGSQPELMPMPGDLAGPAPADSATLTNGLSIEDTHNVSGARHTQVGQDGPGAGKTTAFSDRPKTALGVGRAIDDVPNTDPAGTRRPRLESGPFDASQLDADHLSARGSDASAPDTWRANRPGRLRCS